MKELIKQNSDSLVKDLRQMIDETRSQVAVAVNAGLTILYWRIGSRIRTEVLQNERAEYGEQIVASVSRQLTAEYGKGFARPNLFRMLKFAEQFPDEQIVSTLSRQLSWSHFLEIQAVKNDLARDFYAEMCRFERWSVRTLRERINSMLFERTAISRKPEETIKRELEVLRDDQKLTPDLVFRDPYFLEFLNLADSYSEKDLEGATLRELERFLLELGSDFAFIARQKRITIDDEDYYLDLLFYHRKLRRLILLELKIGKLKAADIGQIELYLRWLDKHERQTGEDAPIGLILCTEKGGQMVELLELEQRGIRVAEYLTELPPRELLEQKLLEAVRRARLESENK
ncbi:MAG: PDDEXK nuclease domain-containing protein [Acidobacteriota bacterium]|nr:PDDEXK nuclease domain-containing protein [Acidobacteriota bacterium]